MSAYVELLKPGVTRMCLLMAAGGYLLAPGPVDASRLIATLVGTGACVGGANALNMWWERDLDALMARTRRRPLPAGRLTPRAVLGFGIGLAALGVAVLLAATTIPAALLGLFAVLSYVLVYTPLKVRTPLSLVIGAVPGAVPPLLGWAAATGRIDGAGVALFAILLVWQIPHFLAIALYRKHEYARAGIRVVPVARNDAIAKIQAVAWTTLLVPVSLMPTPLGVTGTFYAACALGLGMAYLGFGFTGLDNAAGGRWARGFFLASLVYLPALTLALLLDRML